MFSHFNDCMKSLFIKLRDNEERAPTESADAITIYILNSSNLNYVYYGFKTVSGLQQNQM